MRLLFFLPFTSWYNFSINIHFSLVNSDVSNCSSHSSPFLWILICIFLWHTSRLYHFTDDYYSMSVYLCGSSNLNDNSSPCIPRNLLLCLYFILCFVRLFPVVLHFVHSLSNLLLSFFTACKIFLFTKHAFFSALQPFFFKRIKKDMYTDQVRILPVCRWRRFSD
jgi:hypothetical protein